MGPITEAGFEAASNTDILQGTRLQTVPSNGVLTFEMQASDLIAANSMAVSIQLPNGDTPMNGVLVPQGDTAGVTGVLNSRNYMRASYPIAQGGHCSFSVVEVGDTELTWRVTFTPIA